MTSEALQPQYLTIAGKRVVVLEAADYERLAKQADVWEPPMPPADAVGNIPANEAMAVSLARDIIRSRRQLGLSQVELARLADISLQTLERLERGTSNPNTKVVEKVERALKQVKGEADSK